MNAALSRLRGYLGGLDPVAIDRLIAAVLLIAIELQVWTASQVRRPLLDAIVVALLAVAVAARRRWLLPALVVITVSLSAAALVYGSDVIHGPGGTLSSLLGLLLFYSAGAHLSGRRSLLGLALGIAIVSLIALTSTSQIVANLIWDDAVLGLSPWFVGRLMRERSERARAARERAERLDAEHEYHERAAALGERARLAREIHDVIAHSVSVMVIQSAGARSVMDRDPGRAEASLRSVERAGREALAEMRRLLGVLGDGGELRELAPQPGLDDLGELLASSCEAGLTASMRTDGEPVAVPPGLGLCVYRVVQEALTNTIKHAGDVRADVLIRWAPDALELEVLDQGNGTVSILRGDSGGEGITGMRERTALHGGTVEAGPAPGGGFVVRARIPLLERSAAA